MKKMSDYDFKLAVLQELKLLREAFENQQRSLDAGYELQEKSLAMFQHLTGYKDPSKAPAATLVNLKKPSKEKKHEPTTNRNGARTDGR